MKVKKMLSKSARQRKAPAKSMRNDFQKSQGKQRAVLTEEKTARGSQKVVKVDETRKMKAKKWESKSAKKSDICGSGKQMGSRGMSKAMKMTLKVRHGEKNVTERREKVWQHEENSKQRKRPSKSMKKASKSVRHFQRISKSKKCF